MVQGRKKFQGGTSPLLFAPMAKCIGAVLERMRSDPNPTCPLPMLRYCKDVCVTIVPVRG